MKLAALLSWILAGVALGHPAADLLALRQAGNACAAIRDQIDDPDTSNGLDRYPTIKPSLAYQCLESVPLDVERDKALLDYLRPVLDWHSTLTFLTDPPEGYLSQGVDLVRGFEDIKNKLDGDEYENQYEFTKDLFTLINIRPRDGHMSYTPVLLDIFTFEMTVTFVSVASDVTSMPSIYVYSDKDAQGYEPSPVKSVNGKDADEFALETTIFTGILHDPDARYNEYFRSPPTDFFLRYKMPVEHMFDMPDTTRIEFENGTTREYENVAYVRYDFDDISSGADIHQDIEVNASQEPDSVNFLLGQDDSYAARVGYPEPDFLHPDNISAGYIFDSGDLSDIAVLEMHAFIRSELNTSVEFDEDSFSSDPEMLGFEVTAAYGKIFADVMIDTIREAKDQGKSKLLIDLSGNTGGALYTSQLAYQVLFPGPKNPWRYRARATPQLEWLGGAVEKALDAGLLDVALPEYAQNMIPWPLGHEYMVNEDEKPFDSFADLFGPEEIGGDNYTKLAREAPLEDTDEWPPPFAWDKPWDEAPYKPEDITIVTDGNCISACAFFAGVLSREHGVRTIAMGGRPIEAPMQSMGGTKGGPTLQMESISLLVDFAEIIDPKPSGLETVPGMSESAPIKNAGASPDMDFVVNVGNVYPSNSMTEDQIPLQFLYEAANCKLFYTWDMVRDARAVWEAVAKVAWGDGKCVSGSTTNDDGTIGDDAPGYSDKVKDTQKLAAGPGSLPDDDDDNGSGASGGNGGGDNDDDEEDGAVSIAGGRVYGMVVALATVFAVQCMM